MNTLKMLGLVSCLGVVGVAVADDAASIQSHMDAYCVAMKNHGFAAGEKALDSAFAPNAQIVDKDGKSMTFSAWKNAIGQTMKSFKSIDKITLKLSNFHATGDSATGVESFVLAATMVDPSNPKKTVKLGMNDTDKVTFKKSKGHWWITKTVSTSTSMTIDGKPIKM